MKRTFQNKSIRYKDFTEEELSSPITYEDLSISKEEGYDADRFKIFEDFSKEPHTLQEYLQHPSNFFIFIRKDNTPPFGIMFGSITKIDPEIADASFRALKGVINSRMDKKRDPE